MRRQPESGAGGEPGWLPGPLLVRSAHLSMWALVAVGAVAGVAGLIIRDAPSAATAVGPAVTAEPGVGAFAELFVAAYLTAGDGTEETLEPFLRTTLALPGVTPGGLRAERTAVMAIRAAGDGYWAVTVAAEVITRVDGVDQPGGIRHYSVGVAQDGASLVAADLPGQVAPPPAVGRPRVAGPGLRRPDPADPVVAAGERFAAALLAGDGELGRYTAPGAGLRPIEPAPFARVRLERIALRGDEDERTARVEVRAETIAGQVQLLHYELRLEQRAGRWEVTAVTGAPRLAGPAPTSMTGSSPTTTVPAPSTSLFDPLPPFPHTTEQQGGSVP